MGKLNEKQKLFAKEYVVDLCATQAAIRVGYSERTAYSQGHDLLKKPEIQQAIQKARAKVEAKTEISLERVIQEFAFIAFSDPREAVKWGPAEYQTELEDGTIARSSGVP